MRRWSSWRLILVLVLASLVPALPATVLANHNHFNQYEAVRRGRIYYDNRLSVAGYSSAFATAVGKWNALGSINIRSTPAGENRTLVVSDYRSSELICGKVPQQQGLPMRLQANSQRIDGGSCGSSAPMTLFLHELGHTLKIYDHTTTSNWYDVMYVFMVRHDQYGNSWQCPSNLQDHDIHDYRTQWG